VLVADGHIRAGRLGIGLLGQPQTEAMMIGSCTAKFSAMKYPRSRRLLE
jgi:hypothetical protein